MFFCFDGGNRFSTLEHFGQIVKGEKKRRDKQSNLRPFTKPVQSHLLSRRKESFVLFEFGREKKKNLTGQKNKRSERIKLFGILKYILGIDVVLFFLLKVYIRYRNSFGKSTTDFF